MEKTSPLSVHHLLIRISTFVYDSNNIPVGLGIVSHKSYTWQAVVVHDLTRLTWSNIIREFSMSPPDCIRLTRSTSLPGPTSDILKTKTLSMSAPCPGNIFCCMNFQLLAPCNLVIMSMTPKRRIILNMVTALRMLGKVTYLHQSKLIYSLSSSKIFCGSPSLAKRSGPNISFAVSSTIVERVADRVRST